MKKKTNKNKPIDLSKMEEKLPLSLDHKVKGEERCPYSKDHTQIELLYINLLEKTNNFLNKIIKKMKKKEKEIFEKNKETQGKIDSESSIL